MSNTVAFFDMDRTILTESSGILYLRYLRQRGQASWTALARAHWYAFWYKVGSIDYPAVAAKLASSVSTNREDEMIVFCQRWFDAMVIRYIAPRAVQHIRGHQAAGHLVVILSAATPYVVAPVANHLATDDFLCTQLEVVDGRLTGRIVDPPCYGAGKAYWAEQYLCAHDGELGQAYFYTDSHSDLPLLEKVGHPIAVNPDVRLRRVATLRGWPVERLY